MNIVDLRLSYDDLGAALDELNHLRGPEFSGINANIRQRIGWVRARLAKDIEAASAERMVEPDLLAALNLLVADVADYEPWQRPCHALDVARAAIAKATP